MIAGKDLEAGGSWMGVDAAGRFAAVTNFRELEQGPAGARSRGELVTDYLLSDARAESYLTGLVARANQYRGYNLLLTDGSELYCASNRGTPIRSLSPGVHGVCNGPLDSDWPKVKRGCQLLTKVIDQAAPSPKQLFQLLRDRTQPADEALPDTGVGIEWERLLGTIAIDGTIAGKDYGTRSASVLFLEVLGHGQFFERSRLDDASWQQREFSLGST
jgi:uncharacterized protein with NRDE domain